MISDRAVWTGAHVLVNRCGASAEIEGARRADIMLDRGNRDGHRLAVARPRCSRHPRGGRQTRECRRRTKRDRRSPIYSRAAAHR
jgi:hypothetical protein